MRAAQARNNILRNELQRANGQVGQQSEVATTDPTHPYPALRQLPLLAVQWANLYRSVRIHETVFDLLSEEYETARIEEVKSIPTVSVIDSPGLPERKSGPHRVLIVLSATVLSVIGTAILLLIKRSWLSIDRLDARRVLATDIHVVLSNLWNSLLKKNIFSGRHL